MSLLKTCAAFMSLILALQSGCGLCCYHAEGERVSSTTSAPVPACHGEAPKSDGGEQKPSHDHSSSKDCNYLQAADDNSNNQTKLVKVGYPAASAEFPNVEVSLQLHVVPSNVPDNPGPPRISPPSSLILRI